jgi:hypothetical protein
MEAEKVRVESRVPTGLHAHLNTREKNSPNRAGPEMGLADWAIDERWFGEARISTPTTDEIGPLTRGARTHLVIISLTFSTVTSVGLYKGRNIPQLGIQLLSQTLILSSYKLS